MDKSLVDILNFFTSNSKLIVRQLKEWVEIIVDFETKNTYEVLTENQQRVGMVLERSGGFTDTIKRWILRSHRPLKVDVYDQNQQHLLYLHRGFFFFFSDLWVKTGDNMRPIGSVHRKFSILSKNYELKNQMNVTFGYIKSPIWRLWTFPIYNRMGKKCGVITKKWQGLLSEAFTDADQFLIDFGLSSNWKPEELAVIFAASISVDFDFFEENKGVKSVGSLVD